MKKTIRKMTAWFMAVCVVIGLMPVFGSAAAAQAKPIPSTQTVVCKTVSAGIAPQEDNGFEGLEPKETAGSFWDLLKAIAENLRSVNTDDILKLPADVMDDVVTYIFAVIKILGINLDSLYGMLFSLFAAK